MADKNAKINNARIQQYKQKLGIFMCVLYAMVYAIFVIISVYDVTLMDTLMPFGLNLSVFYGLGLIVFALILAVFYSRSCTAAEKKEVCETEQNQSAIKEVG